MGIVLLSIGLNILLIGLVSFLARRRISRLLSGGEALDVIKEEINRLVVELNQTADRNIGIIEERIGRLKKLVDEADRKIMLLGKESEKVRLGIDVYDRLKKSKPLVFEEQPRQPMAETAQEAPEVAPRAAARETPADRVLALHRQGFDPKIIASKTGSPLGEIELIISLADGAR